MIIKWVTDYYNSNSTVRSVVCDGDILFTCGKHWHESIISLKREVCANKISLTPPLFTNLSVAWYGNTNYLLAYLNKIKSIIVTCNKIRTGTIFNRGKKKQQHTEVSNTQVQNTMKNMIYALSGDLVRFVLLLFLVFCDVCVCVLFCLRPVSCVPNVSGLSIFDCPFGLL